MNLDDAIKHIDLFLTEEARLALKGEAYIGTKTRHAIERLLGEVLARRSRSEPDSAQPEYGRSAPETCVNCGAQVENYQGRWVDEGTNDLVFCHDQDETHDGIRHAVMVGHYQYSAQCALCRQGDAHDSTLHEQAMRW